MDCKNCDMPVLISFHNTEASCDLALIQPWSVALNDLIYSITLHG